MFFVFFQAIDSCQPWLSGPSTSINEIETDVLKIENNNKSE